MKMYELTGTPPDSRSYKSSEMFPDNTAVGLEIEVENAGNVSNHVGVGHPLWQVKKDGSLRNNGKEFVFAQPLFGNDIVEALEAFKKWRISYEAAFPALEINERTGIHLHVNIANLEFDEFSRFVLFFLAFERILYNISGGRDNNIYCLPLHRVHDIGCNFSGIFNGNPKKCKTDKYIGFNTAPMWNLGSVELRFHKGSIDTDELLFWIRCVLYIKHAATAHKADIFNFPHYVSEFGPVQFTKSIFPKEIFDVISYNGFQHDLLKGVRFAQEVLYHDRIQQVHDKIAKTISGPKMTVNKPLLHHFAAKKGIEIKCAE